MSEKQEDFNQGDQGFDQGEQIQRLLYRIIPFWPLIVITIIAGYFAARSYLRYQVPIYTAKARLIVNDESEQKSANLQELFKIDNRNITSETEKEIQILSSKELLKKIASKLQLNVNYIQKGRIRTTQIYSKDVPFNLEIENPDSVKIAFSGKAELINNTINFNGEIFPIDSLVPGKFGNIRWTLNKEFKPGLNNNQLLINIIPLNTAVEILKGSLNVAPISKQSSILDLTYSDALPARAVAILNNLISIYGTSAVDYKSRNYENSQKFLDERLKIVADELNGVEKNLQSYKSNEGIVDLGTEGQLYLSQVKETDKKIAEFEVQMDVLNQISQYINKRNSTNDAIPATLGISDPVLTNLLNQLYQTEAELIKIRELSGNKNPQIEVFEEAIGKLKPGIINSINNLKINMTASRNRLKSENDRLSGILNKIPAKERLLIDISRQQSIKNAIYTFLLQKREESAIAAASIVPNYRLIEKPEKGGIISPEPKKIYTVGILMALILTIVYIYLREFASKRVLFRGQIENALPVPVISELIYHKHNPISPIVVGDGKRTLIAEQFRELRTNINYIADVSKGKGKVILFTSSIPKEGKSFVAINSAISISLTGDKVVLLEFDMRKPKISMPLGIEKEPGLSNYLIGKATVEEIIKPHSSIKNFYIVPSGPIPPNPAELLTRPSLNELFVYLKDNFDFILIDSPPIAAVTDAKILAGVTDATIYIIRHNYTNFSFLNLINDVIQKKNLPNINVVFNGIANKKILGYGYGKGYGYGYGNGYGYGYGYTIEENEKTPRIKRFFTDFFSIIFGQGKPKIF